MEKLGTISSKNNSGQLEELFLRILIGSKDNNSKKFLESTQILIKKNPLKNQIGHLNNELMIRNFKISLRRLPVTIPIYTNKTLFQNMYNQHVLKPFINNITSLKTNKTRSSQPIKTLQIPGGMYNKLFKAPLCKSPRNNSSSP